MATPNGGDLLVQEKLGDQSQQNVSQRCRGQHIREIGPGEGGHVRGKEAQQKENPQGDPGIQDSQKNIRKAMQ